MQIKNPSNNAIENVKIFGVTYSIEAEGTLDNVPEAHARYWQESLHKFLILRKDKLEAVKEDIVEVPAPVVEEVKVESPVEATPEVAAVSETSVSEEVKEEVVAPVVVAKPKIVKGKK